MSYEVFQKKNDTKWSTRKAFAKHRLTKDTFDTIEEAEQWIRDNYKPKHEHDVPWIDHVINGYTGHLMTLEQWKEDCDNEFFIDDDGYGDLVDKNYNIIEEFVYPSDYTVLNREFPEETKYILWYNR